MTSRNVLACAFMIASIAVVAAQLPTFSTLKESVRVDVLVTEGGRILRDLRPEDFEVRDEGVAQQVELVSLEQLPLNVVLALDASHSVSGGPLEQLRHAGHALLDALHLDDRAAVITFDDRARLLANPTLDLRVLHAALDDVRPAEFDGPGSTSIIDATYAALVVSESVGRRPLVIVFSDGVDTGSWLRADSVLDAARSLNVVVYGVTVHGSGDTSFLRHITKLTGGSLLEAESTLELRSAFIHVLEEFRNRYVLSYTPRVGQKPGWHRLEVQVKRRRATVSGRVGYMAGR